MNQEPSQGSQRMDAETAVRKVKVMGDRAKLLQQARKLFQWSDCCWLFCGVMWVVFAYRELNAINTYKVYDMQRLTPTQLLSPAADFTMGLGFTIFAIVSALGRRVDALVKLLEHPQEPSLRLRQCR